MPAPPVSRDQELELQIDSLAYGGNGVARLNGFVVFVRRGLPGDLVRARATKVKRTHAEALAVDVVTPSPLRVEAPCQHYPACGGCRFQDLAYEGQVAAQGGEGAAAARPLGGGGARARARAAGGGPTPPWSRSSRPRRSSTTATSSSTRSRRRPRARRSGSTRPAA